MHLLIVIVSSKIPPNHSVNYARCLAWHMVHLLTKVDSLLIRTQLMSPCTRTHLLDGWLSKLLPRDINHPGESLFDSEKTVRVIIYQADHQQQCEICFTLRTENDMYNTVSKIVYDRQILRKWYNSTVSKSFHDWQILYILYIYYVNNCWFQVFIPYLTSPEEKASSSSDDHHRLRCIVQRW